MTIRMDNALSSFKEAKVREFLEAKGRNSVKTVFAYKNALTHLGAVITLKYSRYDNETIVQAIIKKKVDVYSLLNDYVGYLHKKNTNPKSIRAYLSAIRSYFSYHDIDIIPSKFQKRVSTPRVNRIDEEAIETADIRKILLACNNRRLKSYLLVLASSGMRAVEGLSIRNKDIDFNNGSPIRIKIRAEFSKTRTERTVYISDEAGNYVKQWLEFKYKNPRSPREYHADDLVFSNVNCVIPQNLYNNAWQEFNNLLKAVKLNERKGEGSFRYAITIHSLRRFVYTTICDTTDQAYAEWFLGHSKSEYHTKKEAAKREIYATKIMKYLTFLDYSGLEVSGKSVDAKLEEKDKEILNLKQELKEQRDAFTQIADDNQKSYEKMRQELDERMTKIEKQRE